MFQGQYVAAIERSPGGIIGNRSDSVSALIDAYIQAHGDGVDALSKLLGHTKVQTMARYAHLAASPVKGAPWRLAICLDEHSWIDTAHIWCRAAGSAGLQLPAG